MKMVRIVFKVHDFLFTVCVVVIGVTDFFFFDFGGCVFICNLQDVNDM